MPPTLRRCLVVAVASFLAPFARGQSPEPFDAFVARAAAEWERADPQSATVSQYFQGAEQDAVDRQLVAYDSFTGLPILPVARDRRVAQARQVLEQLAQYKAAQLT